MSTVITLRTSSNGQELMNNSNLEAKPTGAHDLVAECADHIPKTDSDDFRKTGFQPTASAGSKNWLF